MAEQTIITAAVETDLPTELLSSKYYVSPGVVSKERATNV
jgi:DNA replication and repair protein RecF